MIPRPAPALVTALAALALAACADGPPGSVLAGPRVLAIVADPPTVGLDQTATLTLLATVDGEAAAPARATWRACPPWAIIADPERDCALGPPGPPGAIGLAVDDQGRAVFAPGALAEAWGVAPPPAGDDPCAEATVDVTVVVEAELAGATLLATKAIEVGRAPAPRQNPVIAGVLYGGAPLVDGAVLPAGSTGALTAELEAASIDRVCGDGATAPDTFEDVRVYVYAGGGATTDDDDIESRDDGGRPVMDTLELTLPDAPATVPLWLVAVDDDGGVGVLRRTITVQ